MKNKIILVVSIVLLASCSSKTETDFCKFATKNADRSVLNIKEVIEKCTVAQQKLEESEAMGVKVKSHKVKLELDIVYSEDDCDSSTALNCGLLGQGCIKKPDGSNEQDACKYPDKVIRNAKGSSRKMVRNLRLDEIQNEVVVISNKTVQSNQ